MKRKETEKSVDKHIRITDITLLEMFDKIMEHPKFNTFNKVLNEALYCGLPILKQRLFEKKDEQSEELVIRKNPLSETRKDEEFYGLIVQLLREIALNETINKSMLSSLFNLHAMASDNRSATAQRFIGGEFSDTPEYLENYELRELKNLRRSRK